jgi:hypothetical protein
VHEQGRLSCGAGRGPHHVAPEVLLPDQGRVGDESLHTLPRDPGIRDPPVEALHKLGLRYGREQPQVVDPRGQVLVEVAVVRGALPGDGDHRCQSRPLARSDRGRPAAGVAQRLPRHHGGAHASLPLAP